MYSQESVENSRQYEQDPDQGIDEFLKWGIKVVDAKASEKEHVQNRPEY